MIKYKDFKYCQACIDSNWSDHICGKENFDLDSEESKKILDKIPVKSKSILRRLDNQLNIKKGE